MNAVTDAVAREQAALRLMLGNPVRSVPTLLRPDMKLAEPLDAWKSMTPTPGAQGAHETATTVADFIDYWPARRPRCTAAQPLIYIVSRYISMDCYNEKRALGCLGRRGEASCLNSW